MTAATPDGSRLRDGSRTRRSPAWILHAVAWIGLVLTLWPAIIDAVAGAPVAWRIASTVVFWLVWVLGVAAIAVPRPWGLVSLRLGGMIAVEAAVWCAFAAPADGTSNATALALRAAAVVVALGACGVSVTARFGDRMIDGASYPGERRFGMRMPGDAVIGIAIAVALPAAAFAAIVATATSTDVARVVFAVVAILCVLGTVRTYVSLLVLARRWLVLAPRAVAVVDPYLMADAMTIPLQRVIDVSVASDDTSAESLLDLRAARRGDWVQLLTDEMRIVPAARPLPDRVAALRPPLPERAIGVALPLSLPSTAVAVLAANGLPTGAEHFDR